MEKNIAVVGCGYWGKNLVRNLHELKGLYAVCDSDKKRLDHFKEQYPDIRHFEDYNELLQDTHIKAVVISTPAASHYGHVKQAVNSDKDVFVEKPIALTYEEGEDLVFMADDKNKILMVGHILEYHPAVVRLKDMIRKGELGKINYIYSNRLNLGKFRTEENILWSFAPHDISVIITLLEEMPIEISAHGGNFLNKNIADVTVSTMRFPSGTQAHIFVSWLHPYKEQRLIVIGDKKMVLFDDVNPDDKLFSFDHEINWVDGSPVPLPKNAEPIKIERTEPLKNECQHFMDCILTRARPLTDGEKGLKVLKVLEACQVSLREKGNTHDSIRR